MRRASVAAGLLVLGLLFPGCAALQPEPDPDVVASLRREREEEAARRSALTAPLPPPARPAEPAGGPSLWLDVERPGASPPPTVRTGWVEVKGHAGTRENVIIDVVIVLDASGSTQYASGADVNGNGVVGVRRKRIEPWQAFDPSFYSSDPGDSVLDAELEATRRLIERLDPRRTRIGLVSFSDLARLRAPLGSSRELLEMVLADLAGAFGAGPTNLAEATRLAIRMLRETGEEAEAAPDPVVLILSDGYPTHPEPEERAVAEALAAAEEAARAGVRVSSLSLGIEEPRDPDVFARMAAATGGEHLRVETPGDVVKALPAIDLSGVAALAVENVTTGEAARATRVRPDGSFDAWVRLRPGENRLRISARGVEGGSAERERIVFYDDSRPDPEERARIQKAIELRTLELELQREIREARQRRVLTLEPDAEAASEAAR